jgi:predicted TIM-barrel fold metal-dependent hydrolase
MQVMPILAGLDAARCAYLASGDEALLPIIDAHHHFWAPSRNPHPWLRRESRIPFRYGDYAVICRDFLPADYDALTGSHRVLGHVLMEGEWDSADPLGEARWVHELAEREGRPQALAAQIRLDRDDVPSVLAAYRELPLVKSVRHKPNYTSRASWHGGWAEPGSMRCPRWRAGYARLADAKLMFELQAPWWHMVEAAELARDFPATTLIVNHAGLPAERDAVSLAAWQRAMERLAECRNVVVKVSGLGVPGQAWTAELQRPVVHALLAAFGTERCLFASNFPVDSLVASFDDVFGSFKALTRHLQHEARLALFCDNAVRLYGLHD